MEKVLTLHRPNTTTYDGTDSLLMCLNFWSIVKFWMVLNKMCLLIDGLICMLPHFRHQGSHQDNQGLHIPIIVTTNAWSWTSKASKTIYPNHRLIPDHLRFLSFFFTSIPHFEHRILFADITYWISPHNRQYTWIICKTIHIVWLLTYRIVSI